MHKVRTIEGQFRAPKGRIAIVASRFNSLIVDRLVEGACDALMRHGVEDSAIDIVYVPGAYEIPLIAKQLANTQSYNGIVALGAVIRGATAHFDYVANGCASGIAQVALDTGIPVAFGVLTTDTVEQAIERAGTKAGNKGFEAALSCLETVDLIGKING